MELAGTQVPETIVTSLIFCSITIFTCESEVHVVILKGSIQMSQVHYYHKGVLRTSGLGSGICYIFADTSKEEEGGKKLRKTYQKNEKTNAIKSV